MQAASSICTVRWQFLQAQWTLVKVFRYKNSSFDLTYHFDCLLDNSFTNSPGIHQATMFFFVGPQGQYLMWFTGPYRFLLASGQRASVSVEPWTHVKLQHFKGLIYNFRPDFKNSPMLGRHTSEKVILQFFSLFLHDYVNCETLYKYFCSTTTSIVRFTLNSSTRIIEFRGFLIQFL